MKAAGFGIKAATITPRARTTSVAQPDPARGGRRQGHPVRAGRRIPVRGRSGRRRPLPDRVVRMAVGDAYGAEQWREEADGDEIAFRTERISRSTCHAVAEFAFRTAERIGGRVYGGPKWTVSPVYEGMLKEEMDAAAARHPTCRYQPVLVDAMYAGLHLRRRRAPPRSSVAEPRRRLPLGPRHADVRLHRRRRVGPARLRRRLRRRRRDGRGPARHRAVAVRQGPREPDGDDPRVRRRARLRVGRRAYAAPTAPRARSTRGRSRRSAAAPRRSTSADTPRRPSSRTRSDRRAP